jgi:hypothetical protein
MERPRSILLSFSRYLTLRLHNADIAQVYAILDEVFLAGEIEETSKQVVLDRLDYLEKLE